MTKMSRTTIMADDALLDQLRAIAKEEGISLGEVIRQGLEWRAQTQRRVPSFIAAVASERSADAHDRHETAARSEELIAEYIRAKHARR
jgi:hypothetical protein